MVLAIVCNTMLGFSGNFEMKVVIEDFWKRSKISCPIINVFLINVL